MQASVAACELSSTESRTAISRSSRKFLKAHVHVRRHLEFRQSAYSRQPCDACRLASPTLPAPNEQLRAEPCRTPKELQTLAVTCPRFEPALRGQFVQRRTRFIAIA